MLLSIYSFAANAQQKFSSQREMEKALAIAEKDMIAKQPDKTFPVTETLMAQLKREKRYNSSFGFKVRMVHGLALFESDRRAETLDFLWALKDESKKYKEWMVLTAVCVEMAKIQEIANQPEEAYQKLQEAHSTIQAHQIDSLYPAFAVRYSSWHRVFGVMDSAYFYAEEAISSASLHNKVFEEAEGNMLLAIYKFRVSQDENTRNEAFQLLIRASFLYKKANEYSTYASLQNAIASRALSNEQYDKATSHLDSAIYYNYRLAADDFRVLGDSYGVKTQLHKILGNTDSVNFYSNKEQEAKIEFTERDKRNAIAEVEKKYNFEKKNEELKAEKTKNRLLIVIVVLFIIFSTVLFLYYSRLRKANELARQQAEELKNLDQLKSQFFANVSHELRTPLTLILSPIREILANGEFDKKNLLSLTLIEKNTQRLQQMVNEILDLSKLDADKMTVNAEPISWHLLLKQTYANFESLADLRNVDFELKYSGSEQLIVALDRMKMETIFGNLLSNAFKFTPSGGKIMIVAGTKDQILWAEVADTGRGILPEDLPYVFDRFYQTKNKNQAAEGGTGIGLALTQELVALLKGEIEVKSELGKGTTFKFQIPLEEVHEAVLEETSISHTAQIKNHETAPIVALNETTHQLDRTILLVEDNPDLSLFIRTVLEEYYTVITAFNGQEALDLLAEKSEIELVLSDVMMPVMDGFQLLENLKSSPKYKNLPIIMLTARASLKDKLNALRIGVDDYLTKPFVKEELMARIDNLLQNAQGRKDALSYELEENVSTNVSTKEEKIEDHTITSSVITEEDSEIKKWLDDLEQVLLKNIELPKFNVDDIATQMLMSKRQLYRKIKQHIGVTPLQYIKTYKLNYARQLLETNKVDSVKAASYSIGYPNTVYFSREFKKTFGRLPSEYLS